MLTHSNEVIHIFVVVEKTDNRRLDARKHEHPFPVFLRREHVPIGKLRETADVEVSRDYSDVILQIIAAERLNKASRLRIIVRENTLVS